MSHVIVKLSPGKSEQQKKARRRDHQSDDGNAPPGEESVSVAIEEVNAADWTEKATSPIFSPSDTLYKEPGYEPLTLRYRAVHRKAASLAERWRSALTTSAKAAED
jgi:phenylpyruvate tautomerase PptA (4-oxalocrotonate tautomerase family)